MKRVVSGSLIALVLMLVLIQLVPVDRSNPPVETDIDVAEAVKAVLKRACYDCHSNETVWPWYSRVAPMSWLVAWDVHEGREELNFSTWNRYSHKERAKKIQESWEEVEEREMPPWFYVPLHPEARLSDEDLAVLRAWGAQQVFLQEDEEDHDDDSD